MSTLGGLTAGLAFLPTWLNEARDTLALDALFSGWVRTSGWRSAGVVWPADSNHGLMILAKPDGVETLSHAPAELPGVLKSLRAGSATVLWQVPNSAGKLYAQLSPGGRAAGVVWIERPANEPWTDADRNYLKLSVKLIERSPALTAKIGPVVDPERLQQRLTDAALIAGRMAHDFDNILTGIIGFADLTIPLLPPGTQQSKFVTEISKVGQRGTVFTQQLHQLARSAHSKPQPSSVPVAVNKEELRVRPLSAGGVQVISNIPANLAAVAMDSAPLMSVIGHLLENAVEATPVGGRVVVNAKLVELSATDAKTYLGQVAPGQHVEVTVQDSGPGIKPEVRAKLFVEPFYTTKVRHRGLGLAIVYRTLCAHRSGIRIESVPPPELGTLVRIVIPPAAVRPAVAPSFASTPMIGG